MTNTGTETTAKTVELNVNSATSSSRSGGGGSGTARRPETACHSLPCSIQYDGMAPVGLFFRPAALTEGGTSKGKASVATDAAVTSVIPSSEGDDKNRTIEEEGEDKVVAYAAQFRGRGLLCPAPKSLPPEVSGLTYRIVNGKRGCNRNGSEEEGCQNVLRVESSFRSVFEWQHEHDVRTVLGGSSQSGGGGGLVDRALDWCEVSRSVHDPIPCDEM